MIDEALLYDRTDSPFCIKARICLHLKGVPFRRVPLTLARRRELRRLNPLCKVPVLLVGDRVVADSTAIARYLDTEVPEPRLLPSDRAARAYCLLLEEWADEVLSFLGGAFKWLNPVNRATAIGNTVPELEAGPLEPFMGLLIAARARARYRRWGIGPGSLQHLEDRLRDNLTILDGLLEGRTQLVGRAPTLADVAVAAQLGWLRRYAEGRLIDAVPSVVDWLAHIEALPPFAAALSA